jgi:hypothetical protein
MPKGSGTMEDPYVIELNALSAMKVTALDWYAGAMAGSSDHVDSFVYSISKELLALESSSIFVFYNTLSKQQVDPRLYIVVSEELDYTSRGMFSPFFCQAPFIKGKSKVKYLNDPLLPSDPSGGILGKMGDLKKREDKFFSDLVNRFLPSTDAQ